MLEPRLLHQQGPASASPKFRPQQWVGISLCRTSCLSHTLPVTHVACHSAFLRLRAQTFLQDQEAQCGHSPHEATGRHKVRLTGRLCARGEKPPHGHRGQTPSSGWIPTRNCDVLRILKEMGPVFLLRGRTDLDSLWFIPPRGQGARPSGEAAPPTPAAGGRRPSIDGGPVASVQTSNKVHGVTQARHIHNGIWGERPLPVTCHLLMSIFTTAAALWRLQRPPSSFTQSGPTVISVSGRALGTQDRSKGPRGHSHTGSCPQGHPLQDSLVTVD